MPKYTYSSNNSGGGWWLVDDDWKNLEKAGWDVDWKPARWLGALATTAYKEFATIQDAIDEFEIITGQRVADAGCACCGSPHTIYCHETHEMSDVDDPDEIWDYFAPEKYATPKQQKEDMD